MDRSLSFGSILCYYYFALFKLGFPSASNLTQFLTSQHKYNSPDRSTKSTPSSLNALWLLVNIGFQVLFHSPPGVLFNFPSRYCFTIGHQVVFSLGQWSDLLPTEFHVLCRTLDSTVLLIISHTRLSLPLVCFSKTVLLWIEVTYVVRNPEWISSFGLGSSDFARHYFRNRFLFLFLWLLRCFSSPRFASSILFYSYSDNGIFTPIGFPHSDIYGSMDICSSP